MHTRSRLSLHHTFPALLAGIVVATSALFVKAAYDELIIVITRQEALRLRAGAGQVAALFVPGVSTGVERLQRAASDQTVTGLIRGGPTGSTSSARTAAFVAALRLTPADSLVRADLLNVEGRVLLTAMPTGAGAVDPEPNWALEVVRSGRLASDSIVFSPLRLTRGTVWTQTVAPVRDGSRDQLLVGYIVETRPIRGTGVSTIRQIGGASRLLVGTPGDEVWTDLERPATGPPRFSRSDTVVLIDGAGREAAVGSWAPIAGTPWVVWLESPQALLAAPARQFLRRMVPVALIVSLIGGAVAMVYSRRLTRRIVSLTDAVDRAELKDDGDVERRHASGSELDRLESAFTRFEARVRGHREVEAQVVEAQKLEAVGRLAGGVAHDFNNLLTVIANYSEIVWDGLPEGSEARRDLGEVRHAAERATQLTRQLLAFSRGQVIQTQRLDLNDVIRRAHELLTRVIPSRVRLVLELDDAVGAIRADRGQLEQVLVNLALNASDAMPEGGLLTFRTIVAELDSLMHGQWVRAGQTLERAASPLAQAAAASDGPDPGRRHVGLIVSDSGIGMDRNTQARIFEPFFTTKAPGKGTGLGLASVRGIVTQLGGRIWVYSEPGVGTTFKLFFPLEAGEVEPETAPARALPIDGSGTIIVAEDDDALRGVATRVLKEHGYDVLPATNGEEALRIVEARGTIVSLVLTDVMMPGLSGIELSERLAERWSRIPVLLMSGYADDEVRSSAERGSRRPMLEKPFSAHALLAAVAEHRRRDA